MRAGLIGLALAALPALAAACSGGDEPGVALNELQVVGTHNSYHVEPAPPLLDALRAFDAALADSLQYGHDPITEQLDAGVRQLELDVFADPEGGRFADPKGPAVVGLDPVVDPAMRAPGFKVFHVQDVDQASTCPTFIACLEEVRAWSTTHEAHVPIMILVEVKQDPIPDPLSLGFATPVPIDGALLDALDDEIRSVFADDHVLTPDDVRGDHETLEAAVLDGGWPALEDVRGQVLLALDNTDEVRDRYVAGHRALAGRMLFTSSERGTPEAAFLKLNDPVADGAAIREAVAAGYVVRTRADADTVQARTGDTTMRDAALATGAHWVSTDYPRDDPRLAPVYALEPLVRCNQVSATPRCTPARLTG